MNMNRLLEGGFVRIASFIEGRIDHELLVSRFVCERLKAINPDRIFLLRLHEFVQVIPGMRHGPVCFSFHGIPMRCELIPADDGVTRLSLVLRTESDPDLSVEY